MMDVDLLRYWGWEGEWGPALGQGEGGGGPTVFPQQGCKPRLLLFSIFWAAVVAA